MFDLGWILNPPAGLALSEILLISFLLGLLHGATPDEHTYPLVMSYAIGSYSTRGGAKAGFMFSLGFTIQRAMLTTLGFLGLAAIYEAYDLNGPVYIAVGAAMFLAGLYVLRGKDIHLPLDVLFRGREHHTQSAERREPHEVHLNAVSMKMATVHGLIAGFGFGAYATIITFVLAPQVPGLIYAPLPGLFFGLGTMAMQIIFGAVFAQLARLKKLGENDIRFLGRYTAGKTLYYGGMLFALIGVLVVSFPTIAAMGVSTGNPIPNLDIVNIATVLVLGSVGVIGLGSMVKGLRTLRAMKKEGDDKE